MSGPTPKIVPLTERENKLIEAGMKIGMTSDEEISQHMVFNHAVFCQVGLPRSAVYGNEFRRESGKVWLNVQAGLLDEGNGPVQQPIPYGVMPRLALAWVSSYAKRNNTREIPIGKSAAEFLSLFGMGSDGRRYKTLRKQMHALAAARLQMGLKGRTFNGQPVQQFDAWVPNNGHQRASWPGVMVLSEDYYKSLIESSVPIDNRALQALKGSALALDVYLWLAHRLHRIQDHPVTLYWKPIRGQFGSEYTGKDGDKDFKKKFLVALAKVKVVYPQAKVKVVKGGLLLTGSPPPIPKTAK